MTPLVFLRIFVHVRQLLEKVFYEIIMTHGFSYILNHWLLLVCLCRCLW